MVLLSRYVMNGSPRVCAYCREPLREEAHRRGDRYFCNEFCADSCGEALIRHPSAEDGTPSFSVAPSKAA